MTINQMKKLWTFDPGETEEVSAAKPKPADT